MSFNLEIQKEIDIDIQIDYVECSECGHEYKFSATSDHNGDIQITVDPHNCDDGE